MDVNASAILMLTSSNVTAMNAYSVGLRTIHSGDKMTYEDLAGIRTELAVAYGERHTYESLSALLLAEIAWQLAMLNEKK